MADDADGLWTLSASLDEVIRELNLAREQSTKPKHLYIRARRAAVQAARVLIAAVERGFHEVWPIGWSVVPLLRKTKGVVGDELAFRVWTFFICPSLRRTPKANAGAFDFPRVKTDDQGHVLGPDGKPVPSIKRYDPKTGELLEFKMVGPIGDVTEDYDEADWFAHLQCQVADWVDVCNVAAGLFRRKLRPAGWPVESPSAQPRQPGRKKADYETEQKEAAIAAKWEQARANGIYKGRFAKDCGMTQKELDRLLTRVRKRQSRRNA